MNAIAKVQEQPANVIPTDASSIMAVIARASADPNTDVDKLERLLGMYERITAHQASVAHDEAMNAAQEEMRPIAADASNPQTKSKYASYAALDRALRPIYTKHGFSLAFDTDDCPKDDHVRVVCRVKRAGHTESHHLDMPADGKGAKGGDVMTKTHATGAAVSYGKRYLLGMVFNIAVGEDNDGNASAPAGRQASQAAQDAFADINACDGWPALERWRETKSASYRPKVNEREWQEIISLFNRRADACGG